MEMVVYAVARAAAHYKAGGDDGGADAEAPSKPVVEPFAGRGKEVRPVEDLRIVAANVCGFGLGVELRGAGSAALEADEADPDMGDGCDLLTREGDTLQAALDQLEAGDYALGVYSETRATDLDAVSGHVRRRSAGFDCAHSRLQRGAQWTVDQASLCDGGVCGAQAEHD